jgi:type IV secretory pathway TrbD component
LRQPGPATGIEIVDNARRENNMTARTRRTVVVLSSIAAVVLVLAVPFLAEHVAHLLGLVVIIGFVMVALRRARRAQR